MKVFRVGISSTSKEVQACTVGISGMSVVGDGLPVADNEAPRSCAGWIAARTESFELRPQGHHTLVFEVRAPRGTGGGYYALINVESTPASGAAEAGAGVSAGIHFRYRNYIPILLTVPGPDLAARIEGAQPVIELDEAAGGLTFGVPVRNQGNLHARLKGVLRIESEPGQLIDTLDLGAGTGFLLPEQERLFKSSSAVQLADGIYLARVDLEIEGSRTPMSRAFPFYVDQGVPGTASMTDEMRARLESQSTGFIVMPGSVDLLLRAGAPGTASVEIVNICPHPIELRWGATDWTRASDFSDQVGTRPSHQRSGREYVSVRTPDLTIPARRKKRVSLAAVLPRDARGDFYAAVCFERTDVDVERTPESMGRRSVKVRMTAQGTEQHACEIVSFDCNRTALGEVDFRIHFLNSGNVAGAPEGEIQIQNMTANQTVERIRVREAPLVQAGCEGIVTHRFARILEPAEYLATLNLRALADKPPLTATARFVVPGTGSEP